MWHMEGEEEAAGHPQSKKTQSTCSVSSALG